MFKTIWEFLRNVPNLFVVAYYNVIRLNIVEYKTA